MMEDMLFLLIGHIPKALLGVTIACFHLCLPLHLDKNLNYLFYIYLFMALL
jgi:hypothetical protein